MEVGWSCVYSQAVNRNGATVRLGEGHGGGKFGFGSVSSLSRTAAAAGAARASASRSRRSAAVLGIEESRALWVGKKKESDNTRVKVAQTILKFSF